MAKIRNAKPKESSGGYERIFGDDAVGALMQKVQSTAISNGTELEKIIVHEAPEVIDNLDDWVEEYRLHGRYFRGTYLCSKKVIKKSTFAKKNHEPDMIIFEITQTEKNCYVIELKDGSLFDTKKSSSEHAALSVFCAYLGQKLPFTTKFYLCSFNQENKEEIFKGFKEQFSMDEIMTGRELCEILGMDYDSIRARRQVDASDNFEYFVDEFISIPSVAVRISKKRREKVIITEFYGNKEQ